MNKYETKIVGSNRVATIDIGIDIEDNYFKFPQQAMAQIVDALHNNDKVVLKFMEGVALEELNYKEKKFLQILKELCEDNDWPMEKISFVLPNLVQDKSVWPLIEYGNASITSHDMDANYLLQLQVNKYPKPEKNIQKTFGNFIHRSQWDRVLLSSYLYKNYKDISMQTFRMDPTVPGKMIEMDLDQLFWQVSAYNGQLINTKFKQVHNLIESLPLEQGMKYPDIVNVKTAADQTIMSWYNNIFLDIVCEKTITGQTFFPTEKIARPLATKTPFLIMAAPNYIKNLKRLNFRSFNRWWSEDYDQQQGVQRIESIQRIMDDLAKLDKKQLEDMYQQMQPIVEYNYKTYMEMTPEKILSAFQQ